MGTKEKVRKLLIKVQQKKEMAEMGCVRGKESRSPVEAAFFNGMKTAISEIEAELQGILNELPSA